MKAHANIKNINKKISPVESLKGEFMAIMDDHPDSKLIMEKLDDLQKTDPKMESIEAFQVLIFSYSCESLYHAINFHLFQARYTKLQNYMKNLLRLNE